MIEFKNVSKHFGPTQVLHNIDLNIAQGEVVVIIGPSGSGKSTLLRCINKLEEITSGDLIVDGLKVNDPKVDERLIFIDKGRIAEDGDPQVLIKNPPSQRLQEFLQHVS
ncbi:TPA: ATP-binding cassette domain-containing protein [Escherichia coli]|nr:ATP-binding cassette domain-containing protein [Escherichia coli]